MPSVTASCRCKAFTHTVEFTDDLPAEDSTCNCTSCRERTGQIAIFPMPASEADYEAITKSSLKQYKTQNDETGNAVSSYFCSTCGTKLYITVTSADESKVYGGGWMTGAFDTMYPDDKPLLKLMGHSWLKDTGDGGLGNKWTKADGVELEWFDKPDEPTKGEETPDEYLHLHCRCEGFTAYVSRPKPTLPLPKNCYWYRPPANAEGLPQRYMASWCACDDCRSTTGSCLPAHPWVQIPFVDMHSSASMDSHLIPPETKMTTDTDLPGCTRYKSSPENVSRYFCSTCGATVLYFDDNRDFIGTWAVGLADAKEGVLAQSWLNWWTGMDGHPNAPIHCMDAGRKRWGQVMDDFQDGVVAWGKEVGLRK